MDVASLFNQRIEIYTKSKIRYEGELFKIDAANATVALKNVVSFGTEGRRPGNEITPSTTVYDYISFKGPDIERILPKTNAPANAPVAATTVP